MTLCVWYMYVRERSIHDIVQICYIIITSSSVVDPIKKKKQELRDERFNEFAPPSMYLSSTSSSSDLTSSPKRPKTDTQDLPHTVQNDLSSVSSPSTSGTNQTAGSTTTTGIPAPPYQVGGYFYPPGPYPPPPFTIPPPPPMGMPCPPLPPGGPYFAAHPSMGMGMIFQQSPPTTQLAPQMKPPPPPNV